MIGKLGHAKRQERKITSLAQDIKTLMQWLSHDVLQLAGPTLIVRLELFDFIKTEIQRREDDKFPMIRKLSKALHNQRDDLLAFSGVLDQKLLEISGLMEAVGTALKQTPRASSMVENLNSRLRNYFFLRRTLGDSYLELLQFFLNHRCFMRSDIPERVGKSPKELLTGEKQPHWLKMLGFELFQKA